MPVKILSVDDETDLELLLTQYFRREIRKPNTSEERSVKENTNSTLPTTDWKPWPCCLSIRTSTSSFRILTCQRWTV